MKLVSVIVPIYNGELYLNECLNSITDQSYTNLEIILINDGSMDASGKICEEYAKKDSRIVVVHKENEGQAVARNLGNKIAKGEFIVYVDCDDVVRRDMVERLIEIQNKTNSDIVVGGVKKFVGEVKDSIEKKAKLYKTWNKRELEEKFVNEKGYLLHIVPAKLFKKKLVSNIKFPEIRAIEDEFFLTDVFLKTSVITLLEEEVYYYRQTQESTMRGGFNINRSYIVEALNDRKEKYITIERNDLLPIIQGQILLETAYWYLKLAEQEKYEDRRNVMRKEFNYNFFSGIKSNQISTKLKVLLILNRISPKIYRALLKSR